MLSAKHIENLIKISKGKKYIDGHLVSGSWGEGAATIWDDKNNQYVTLMTRPDDFDSNCELVNLYFVDSMNDVTAAVFYYDQFPNGEWKYSIEVSN